MNSVGAPRLANLTNHYPRLAKPRLGLNSDRCSAAGFRFATTLLLATACGRGGKVLVLLVAQKGPGQGESNTLITEVRLQIERGDRGD